MDLSMIAEFLELFKKFDGLQEKLFEKNAVVGLITLKALIKLVESLLNKLKQKEAIILKEQSESSNALGNKFNKWKNILNKINL
jgi:hypothetical protein